MTELQRLLLNVGRLIRFLKDFTTGDEDATASVSWRNSDDSETLYEYGSLRKIISQINFKNENGVLKDLDGNDIKANGTKAELNLINSGGTIKDLAGNSVNIDKFGGKTLDEVFTTFAVSNPFSFKKLANTSRCFPHRYMIGINQQNQIIGWGHKNTYVQNTGNSDASGGFIIPAPDGKENIEPKEIVATNWSIFILYEDGDLFALGYNGYGQLGTGNTAHVYNKPIKVLDNVLKVTSSSWGYHQDYNTILVLRDIDGTKEVWGAGRNSYGQLARGSNSDNATTFEKAQFSSDLEESDEIIDIFVNDTNVVSTYILTNTGKVFAAGYNGDGCLGLGDSNNRNIFERVTGAIANEKVIQLVCSGGTRGGDNVYYKHSVIALCESGKVFSWGHGAYGDLGLRNTNSYNTPQEIVDFNNINIIKLFGFRGHWTNYFALANDGKVYGWGYNGYGALGIGSTNTTIHTPTLVNLPFSQDFKVKDVYLGAGGSVYSYYHNTMFVVDNNGKEEIYVSGYNGEGQVGDGLDQANSPRKISIPEQSQVKQVSTGGYSSSWSWYVLYENGNCWAWGDNDYQTARLYDSSGYITIPSLIGI